MPSLLLRLTLPLMLIAALLITLMQVVGGLLPMTQIIPIVTYNIPTIILVDVNRQLAAFRRASPRIIVDAVISPDQQRIAFSMSDERQINIYVSGLYDDDTARVTNEALGGYTPAWSPDNRQIAFVGLEKDNKRGIYIVAADGLSPAETIVKAGTFSSPSWSPDGRQLTFAAPRDRDVPNLFVVDSSCRLRCDREMIQITNQPDVDTTPVWSPDGSGIAFLSDRSGDYEIYELDMRCLQADQPECSLQVPQRIHLRRPIVPFLNLWSLDGREMYFRAWDGTSNQPALYAVKRNCADLLEGCQPRLIYNLANLSLIGQGSS
jgi:Tol biopolymer transport system component